ncbi:MAG: 4Fe-4S dicluster domain-containing protein [Acidobacteria bacterium]|nr:4Fe-4S dicluster domain-containing protein [Acidobacteriota bacterium]
MSGDFDSGKRPACKGPKNELVRIGAAEGSEYWRSPEELRRPQAPGGEFPGGLPASRAMPPENTRRDFLSLMGVTLAAAGLAGCRAPVQNAVPLVAGSDDIIPGVANYYATTCRGCASSCSLLVKQRDGRPIKIEGNAESILFGSGTCATGQATVLSLYDDARFRGPMWGGQAQSWEEVDRQVLDRLNAAFAAKGKVVLVSGTITSPSTLEIIREWSRSYPGFRHVVYDPVSLSALREAHARSFGRPMIPHYRFDQARLVLGLEADFLGTWLSPVEFARQYSSARRAEDRRALHIQLESGMSVTGSNADLRLSVAPSEMGTVAVALLARIARKGGIAGVPDSPEPEVDPRKLDLIARELWKHRGESLVVSGSNDVATQMVATALNFYLGNMGKTIDLVHTSQQRLGDDRAMADLVEEMNRGEIHTLMLLGVNPAYDYCDAPRFLEGLEKVALSISFSDRQNETSAHVHALCPDHHFLEAWGDAEPVESHFSLAQPLIAPLFRTRAAQESLLKWSGVEKPDYYSYLREYWQKNIFPRQTGVSSPDVFWEKSLQTGVVNLAGSAASEPRFQGDWQEAVRAIAREREQSPARGEGRYELHFYESVALRDGRDANNPWLQELPDPISKVTWENYAAVAPALARNLGVGDGDVVKISTGRGTLELPVFEQPGQQAHTVSIAIGYGRKQVGKVGQNVGSNVFPLTPLVDGRRQYSASGATVEKTGRRVNLAGTQTQFSMEGRPIVLEATLEELENASSGEALPTLWAKPLEGEHSWGMAIDLDACTGCSACVVACQAENNVPVVGKDQVARTRIMHWIRIDRYYRGTEEDPRSLHQPMMCQHCQNAPCETVCPVLATTTSSEGLNQQVYNRCIGTRYCANNCPYKVRRFNWYNYTENPEYDFNMTSPLGRMVLNPDVAVRSRGVMEKCSMCVQRIQLAKNIALQGKRELADGDIQTACQQACPTEAIVFGDLKDPASRISRLRSDRRHYEVLEELGVRPNVGYLKKISRPISKV